MSFSERNKKIFLTISLALLLIVWINQLAGEWFFRLDLTEGKKYSLAESTETILEELPGTVLIEVYLEGDLNAEFRRLQKSITEMLQEFKIYAGVKLEYKFVNPANAPNEQARERIYQQLVNKGLPATTLFDMVDGEKKQKVIFPGAIISYGFKEVPVHFLKGNKAQSPDVQLNQSIEGVEYELILGIKKALSIDKKKIAYIANHNTVDIVRMEGLFKALSELFLVSSVDLSKESLSGFDAVICIAPDKDISAEEQFKIDQFLMSGKGGMFVMDKVALREDSVRLEGAYALGKETALDELLFRYGARVNADFVMDQRAGPISVVTGRRGDQPNIQQLPWPYYVYFNSFSNHPITKNLDMVYGRYIQSIDTIRVQGIRKIPLIYSSIYSRKKNTPVYVQLNELKKDMDRSLYDQKSIPVAMLLEGAFPSLFSSRIIPKDWLKGTELVKKAVNGNLIVVGDADMFLSYQDPITNQKVPFDYDPVSRQYLSNKDFLINALSYLCDRKGMVTARNKQISMRPLDQFKVKEEQLFWQIFNVVIPPLSLLLLGVLFSFLRKRRYS